MKTLAFILALGLCAAFVGCATSELGTPVAADPSQQMQPNASFINAGNPAPNGAQRIY